MQKTNEGTAILICWKIKENNNIRLKQNWSTNSGGQTYIGSTLSQRLKSLCWINVEKRSKIQIGLTLLSWRWSNVEIKLSISLTIFQRWIFVEATFRLHLKYDRCHMINHEWTLYRHPFANVEPMFIKRHNNVEIKLSKYQLIFNQISTSYQRHVPAGNLIHNVLFIEAILVWSQNIYSGIDERSSKSFEFNRKILCKKNFWLFASNIVHIKMTVRLK